MTKLKRLPFRLLLLVALVFGLTAITAPTTRPQSTACCSACLERFNQCDANNIVCCKIYNSCVRQCAGSCPTCPGL